MFKLTFRALLAQPLTNWCRGIALRTDMLAKVWQSAKERTRSRDADDLATRANDHRAKYETGAALTFFALLLTAPVCADASALAARHKDYIRTHLSLVRR